MSAAMWLAYGWLLLTGGITAGGWLTRQSTPGWVSVTRGTGSVHPPGQHPRKEGPVMSALTGDRCDVGCPAAALVLLRKKGAGDLSLCGHHYGSNGALLALTGWAVVVDLRPQLAEAEMSR